LSSSIVHGGGKTKHPIKIKSPAENDSANQRPTDYGFRKTPVMVALADCGLSLRGESMTRNLREVIAAVPAERRAKIVAAYRQKLIAKRKKRQLEEVKRVMELDRNRIVIVVLIVALPIIAALAAMLTVLAVGHQ
jgi:hypothetical protein